MNYLDIEMDKYAFLMIRFDTPETIKDIQDKLSDEDLYTSEDENDMNNYGIEDDTHVTLAPCLDNDIDIDKLKSLLKPLDEYSIILTNISKFQSDKYDVLKCDAASTSLFNSNTEILKHFKSHSEHKEYHPHATIAYVKKGVADKYLKDVLDKLEVLTPKEFHFSYYDDNGNAKDIIWK